MAGSLLTAVKKEMSVTLKAMSSHKENYLFLTISLF